jgi:hypothetical protein
MWGDYQSKLRKTLERLPLTSPPPPWKCLGHFSVGGITEIGYAPDSDLLLTVSQQGRGLYDCRTGDRIERDRDSIWDGLDQQRLTSPGIGHLANVTIRLAGLHGGGLPLTSPDGWLLHIVPLPWPEYFVFMSDVENSIHFDKWIKIAGDFPGEFRTCGFSETGDSFVVAASSDLLIFSR